MSNFKNWFFLTEEEMPEDLVQRNALAAAQAVKRLIPENMGRGPKLFIHTAGTEIYKTLLTNAGMRPEVKFFEQYADQFYGMLNSLKFPVKTQVVKDEAGMSHWHEVIINSTYKFDRKTEMGAGWNLSFKQYFTYKPPVPLDQNPEAVWESVQKFLMSLPQIAAELDRIGNKYQDFLKFKISEDIKHFLNHADSLVVYHRKDDPQEQAEIQAAVKGVLQSNGVYTAKRKYRSESGFDMKNSLNTLRPDLLRDKEQSHGTLVGSAVAADIAKDMSRFAAMPDATLAQFILQAVQKYNRASPWDLASHFNIAASPRPAFAKPTAAPAATSPSGGAASAPADPTASTKRLTLSGGKRPITMGTPTNIGQAILKGFGFNGFQYVGEEAFSFDKDETGWHINAKTGGANAVLLNGKPVTGRTRLKAGDTVAVGRPEKNVVLGQIGYA